MVTLKTSLIKCLELFIRVFCIFYIFFVFEVSNIFRNCSLCCLIDTGLVYVGLYCFYVWLGGRGRDLGGDRGIVPSK